jgi:hypothetical protein
VGVSVGYTFGRPAETKPSIQPAQPAQPAQSTPAQATPTAQPAPQPQKQ